MQILASMPHSSLGKAASILGLGRSCIKLVGQDSAPHKIDYEKLRLKLQDPKMASIVVISCGEVNTGFFATSSYEEMRRIRSLCDEFDAWLHVDAGKPGYKCFLLRLSSDFKRYCNRK
jgi:glutamate/tyrosine decarboxylase-like PLP-dependent enzyme